MAKTTKTKLVPNPEWVSLKPDYNEHLVYGMARISSKGLEVIVESPGFGKANFRQGVNNVVCDCLPQFVGLLLKAGENKDSISVKFTKIDRNPKKPYGYGLVTRTYRKSVR